MTYKYTISIHTKQGKVKIYELDCLQVASLQTVLIQYNIKHYIKKEKK